MHRLPIVVISVKEYKNDEGKLQILFSFPLGIFLYFLTKVSWNLRTSCSASLVQFSLYRMFKSSVILHNFSTVWERSLSSAGFGHDWLVIEIDNSPGVWPSRVIKVIAPKTVYVTTRIQIPALDNSEEITLQQGDDVLWNKKRNFHCRFY